jgi:hypothetical protein
MASDYTDSFAGDPYFIKKGEQLSAAGMNAALNTKEKVANKVTTIDSNSTDTQYPSAKVVYGALSAKENTANKKDILSNSSTEYPSTKAVTAVLSAKQDKIAAGTANDILTKTTVAGTLSTLTRTTIMRTAVTDPDTTKNASDDKIPTEKAVATALASKANAGDLTSKANVSDLTALQATISNLQEKLPVGTILMYDGDGWQDNVTLKGWYSCNRTNYNNRLTPDLEDKFIKCKGSAPNEGGSNALTSGLLPKHTHGLSGGSAVSDGSHGHEFYGGIRKEYIRTDPGGRGKYILWNRLLDGVDWSGSSVHGDESVLAGQTATNAVQPGGAHGHSLTGSTDDNAGVAGTASNYNNMPSYYSVIYIKKVTENNA